MTNVSSAAIKGLQLTVHLFFASEIMQVPARTQLLENDPRCKHQERFVCFATSAQPCHESSRNKKITSVHTLSSTMGFLLMELSLGEGDQETWALSPCSRYWRFTRSNDVQAGQEFGKSSLAILSRDRRLH